MFENVGSSVSLFPCRAFPQAPRGRGRLLAALLVGAALSPAGVALADTSLLVESFDTDPVAGGRALVLDGDASRFTFDSANQRLIAAYDTSLPTARLAWRIPRLDEKRDFSFSAQVTLQSNGFTADPNGFAQIAFGLINTATTGPDRAGAFGPWSYDIATVDYFPNVNPTFAYSGPTLAPTVVPTDNLTGYYNQVQSPFGRESDLGGEAALPLDQPLWIAFDYDASLKTIRLTVRQNDAGGTPVDVNSDGGAGPGGADGLDDTIQYALTWQTGDSLSVDAFAITLWNDSYLFGGPASVVANVAFDNVTVTPEPSSLLLLGLPALVAGMGLRRRRRPVAAVPVRSR